MLRAAAVLVTLGLITTGCTRDEPRPAPTTFTDTAPTPSTPADQAPRLTATTVVEDLEIPWDIAFLPDGSMLNTERDRERVTLRKPDGAATTVLEEPSGMWHSGETGLEAVIPAPDFARTNDFITCHGYQKGDAQDVRVARWHLDGDKAEFVRNLVTGLPSTSGRHGGCALEIGSDDALFIGTGDAADGSNPQDLDSGGGKVLRVDAATGNGLTDNPFPEGSEMRRRVWTYGHRNVQGLGLRPGTDELWSVEHGPDRDDEVNLLIKGGNYGWNPVPGFNESVPMTDQNLPGEQVEAAWTSGDSTLATSGGTFLRGTAWGKWNGAFAVASLKDESLHILEFDDAGKLVDDTVVEEVDGRFGRLRATTQGPDSSLYLTTSNGSDDKVIRLTPFD